MEMVFPPRCVFTRKEGAYISGEQSVLFKFLKDQDFHEGEHLDGCFACFSYTDPRVRKVVECFKFHGIRGLREFMAESMLLALPENIRTDEVMFVPIPLHWTRHVWRGFNQAETLAHAMAKKTKHGQIVCAIKRVQKTKQQAKLRREDRIQNVNGAFDIKANHDIAGKTIVLVDDVTATGSTLEQAAKVLQGFGAKAVYGVVFARGGHE